MGCLQVFILVGILPMLGFLTTEIPNAGVHDGYLPTYSVMVGLVSPRTMPWLQAVSEKGAVCDLMAYAALRHIIHGFTGVAFASSSCGWGSHGVTTPSLPEAGA